MQEQEKGKKVSSNSKPIPKSEDQQRRHEEEDFNEQNEEFQPDFPDTNYPPENSHFPEDKENRDSRLDLDEEGIDENGYGTEDEEFNDDF